MGRMPHLTQPRPTLPSPPPPRISRCQDLLPEHRWRQALLPPPIPQLRELTNAERVLMKLPRIVTSWAELRQEKFQGVVRCGTDHMSGSAEPLSESLGMRTASRAARAASRGPQKASTLSPGLEHTGVKVAGSLVGETHPRQGSKALLPLQASPPGPAPRPPLAVQTNRSHGSHLIPVIVIGQVGLSPALPRVASAQL